MSECACSWFVTNRSGLGNTELFLEDKRRVSLFSKGPNTVNLQPHVWLTNTTMEKVQLKAHPFHIFRGRQLLFFPGNVWVSGWPFNWLSSEELQEGPYVLDIPQP